MKNGTTQFALCMNNDGYAASLEAGKLYRIVPDEDAAAEGYIRVVDKSDDDYAFSTERFYIIDLPQAVKSELLPRLEYA